MASPEPRTAASSLTQTFRAWAAAASRGPTGFLVTPEQKAQHTRSGIAAAAAALVDTVRHLRPLVHQVFFIIDPPLAVAACARRPGAETESAFTRSRITSSRHNLPTSRSRLARRPSWPMRKRNKPISRAYPAAYLSISGPSTRSMGCLLRGVTRTRMASRWYSILSVSARQHSAGLLLPVSTIVLLCSKKTPFR